jgi:hypothetical protein
MWSIRRKKEENMKITKNLGFLLLGIWLVVTGLSAVMNIPIASLHTILAFLAIVAGALIILGK